MFFCARHFARQTLQLVCQHLNVSFHHGGLRSKFSVMHNNFLGRQADYALEALTAPADYCLPSPQVEHR